MLNFSLGYNFNYTHNAPNLRWWLYYILIHQFILVLGRFSPILYFLCSLVQAQKKKVKKTGMPFKELIYGGMAAADVQKAVEKEFEMALQDRVMEETKDKKNAVEAYVYDMRNKVGFFVYRGLLKNFAPQIVFL